MHKTRCIPYLLGLTVQWRRDINPKITAMKIQLQMEESEGKQCFPLVGPTKPRGQNTFPEERILKVRCEIWGVTNLGKKPGKSIPDKGTTCPHVQRHSGQRVSKESRKRWRGSQCGENGMRWQAGSQRPPGREHFSYSFPNLTFPDPEPPYLGLLSFPEHSLYQPLLCTTHCDKRFIHASTL